MSALRLSHKTCLVALAGLVLAFFFRVVFLGHVVFPHDNTHEVGLAERVNPERLSGQRFSDSNLIYVPSVHHQLNGERSGWLVTWDPHVELGKPANQLAGLGKAFLPMHVASFFTDDALQAYTWMTMLAVALSALFSYLFFKERGLHPAACFVGAAGLGFGYFVGYWLTFAIFIWGIAWTMALLWGVERFLRRPGLGGFLWIAFAVHSLFLSGYPQAIVWNGYVVAGVSLVRLFSRGGSGGAEEATRLRGVRGMILLVAAALLGLASVAPAYLDLVHETQRSGRTELDPNFFVKALPEIGGWSDVGFYLRRVYDDLWYGNPIDHEHPHVRLGMKGLCFTPVFFGLLCMSFAGGLVKRAWGWQLFVGVALVMTVWPGFYTFGVKYLGLSFSRWLPLGAAWIPIMVLGALAADRVVREPRAGRVVTTALALLPAALALAGTLAVPERPDALLVGVALALSVGAALFAWTGKPVLVVLLAVAASLHYGLTLSLTRPPEEIVFESPLVDHVKGLTPGGLRYALVDARTGVLRPNAQPLLDLRTIHAYDSLSPQAYREWAIRLNGDGDKIGRRTEWQLRKLLPSFGRVFSQIKPNQELAGPMLSFAGVRAVVAAGELDIPGWTKIVPGIYRIDPEPLLEAQLVSYLDRASDEIDVQGFLQDTQRQPLERLLDEGDRQRFRTTAVDRESILFLSQQHHPRWSAYAGDDELTTVRINGIYQGVRLPPGTSEVELRFQPLARWAWIPQLGFVIAGMVLALRGLAVSRRASRAAS